MPVCPKCGEQNPQLGGKCPRDDSYYVHEEALKHAETDPRIGTISADKYVIVGRISKGGMGAVYRAIQMPVEREVAFKVLRTEMEDSDQGRDRFVREARAISRLTHPNIITLYDFGFEATGHPYMVMEYAPGKDLAKWIRTEELTLERVIHVIKQLLSALEEAHSQGIVHRDLKPENMIVVPTGSDPDFVKLLDFGIARVITETSTRGLTREGEVFGTPHYMAPEQAQGAKEVGPPADIYAVGIMLYEMITGEAPFDAPTPLAVLLMHLNEPLPDIIPQDGMDLPEMVRAIIVKACAKNVNERYQNAAEMLSDIDEWMLTHGPYATGAFRATTTRTPAAAVSNEGMVFQDTIMGMESPDASNSGPVRTTQSAGGVNIHDPDPSEIVHISQLQPPGYTADQSYEDDFAHVNDSGSKKGLIAVAVTVVLLCIVGGVVAVSLSGGTDPGGDTTVSTNTTDTTNKTDTTTPEDPAPDTADKKPEGDKPQDALADATNTGAGTSPETDNPGETAPTSDTLPTNTTDDPIDGATQDGATGDQPKDQVEEPEDKTKKPRDRKNKGTKTSKDKAPKDDGKVDKPEDKPADPPKDTKPAEEKKPDTAKKPDAWGAPTTEQKKKGIKNDKW